MKTSFERSFGRTRTEFVGEEATPLLTGDVAPPNRSKGTVNRRNPMMRMNVVRMLTNESGSEYRFWTGRVKRPKPDPQLMTAHRDHELTPDPSQEGNCLRAP